MPGRRRVHGNEYQLRRYGNMYGGSQGFPQEIRDEDQGRRRYREQQANYGHQPLHRHEEDYDDEDFEESLEMSEEQQEPVERFRRQRSPGAARGSRSSGQPAGQGGFRGRGPKGYRRSDERITEEVNELLTEHDELDAGDIEVSVQNGEVTLSGTVSDRHAKRLAEDLADDVSGVIEVHNQLRINRPQDLSASNRDSGSNANKGRT